MTAALAGLVQEYLGETEHAWSVGCFGALAEFTRDDGEAAVLETSPQGGSVATGRGALSISLPSSVRAVAYEALSARPDGWRQGLLLCLPEGEARMTGRSCLTELPADEDALRAEERGAALFDMGLGAPNVDVCVRVADERLAATLRHECGRSVLEPGSAAMAAIKQASPTRVYVSRLARLEVYQQIGSTRRNIPTPEGPHTHVLPSLLATGRVVSATTPVPAGMMPGLELHPANPVSTLTGEPRPFERGAHERFQALLERYPPEAGYMREKRALLDALCRDAARPESHAPARTRLGRLGQRVAVRQAGHLGMPPRRVAEWQSVFDRGAEGRRAEAAALSHDHP